MHEKLPTRNRCGYLDEEVPTLVVAIAKTAEDSRPGTPSHQFGQREREQEFPSRTLVSIVSLMPGSLPG